MITLIIRLCFFALLLFNCSARAARKPSEVSLQAVKKLSSDSSQIDKEAYKISVITWNLAEKSPSKKDYSFLRNYRNDDIVVIGAQECEDVRPRREEGHRSRAWRALQIDSLGKSFVCLAQHRMGGLQIGIYAKKNVASKIQGTQILDVACGVGNVLTNKGAICVLLRIKGMTLALINAHLAAHLGKVKERNADYRRIVTSIVARAQPRWLNKEAALQIKKNKLKTIRSGTQGLGSLTSLGAISATSRATEIGKGLKKQYQPWIDQIWKAKLSRKSKSYNGKFSPPLALIKNKKDIKKNNKKGKNSNKSNNNDNASNKIKKNSKDSTYKKSIRKEETTAEDVENSEIIRGKTGLGSKSKISKNLESSAKITLLSTLIEGKKNSSVKKDITVEDSGKKKRNKEEEEEELCPFDSIIFLGDLNYRLDLPRLEMEIFKEEVGSGNIEDHVEALESILEYDQLIRERIMNRAFQGYSEGKILFQPTFKYDRGSNQFDSSSKCRPPAWTDRVLYNMAAVRSPPILQNENINNKRERNNMNITGNISEKDDKKMKGTTREEEINLNMETKSEIENLSEKNLLETSKDLPKYVPQLSLKKYYSIDSRHSDHRPVCAEFLYTL